MPSPYLYCRRCGATNDPGGERCYQCDQPLHMQAPMPPAQQQKSPRRRMSRRAAIWTLAGITATALPVGAIAAYVTYRKQTDPHILTYPGAYLGHSTITLDAAWSPDGTRVASTYLSDGDTVQVQIWNATTGKTLQACMVEHPTTNIYPLDVVWSADGKYVQAFVGWNHTGALDVGSHIVEMVQVWDAATGQRVRSIPVTEPVTVNALGTGTDQPLVSSWVLNARYLATVKPRLHPANEQNDDILEIWDIATGSKIATLGVESQSSVVMTMAWAPDNEKLAIQWSIWDTTKGQYYPTIEIWNSATGNKIATLGIESQSPAALARQIVWAPDSRMIALSYEVWDALSGKRLQTFKQVALAQNTIIWSPDGRFLALGPEVYNVETGNRITTYPRQGTLTSLAWSPDGARVALVDTVGNGYSFRSSTLFILDALNGRQIAKYPGRGLFSNSGTSGQLIWSPDGKYLMVVGMDIDIWRVV